MLLRSLLLTTLFGCAVSLCTAQTFVPDGYLPSISYARELSGSNYTSYHNLHSYLSHTGEAALSPTPEGYKPFYISTYTRHGSRFMLEEKQYDEAITILQNESSRHNLTATGKQLLQQLQQLRRQCPKQLLGTLTDIGVSQHRAIAERLCANYPEVFNSRADIYAQSSTSRRCVLSMQAAMSVIDSLTHAHITQESGREGIQDRIAGAYTTPAMDSLQKVGYGISDIEKSVLTPYQRLSHLLFRAPSRLSVADSQNLTTRLFNLAQNMQSHAFDIDLWKYFTDDEVYTLRSITNRYWYRRLGASSATGSIQPLRSRAQLLDIITAADSVIARPDYHGTNLRYGHDLVLLPLICLMQLGTCGQVLTEDAIDTLPCYWRCEELFPMAGNVQLVFYRPSDDHNGEVLVKALLNEREVSLPAPPYQGFYYRWTDIRSVWLSHILL